MRPAGIGRTREDAGGATVEVGIVNDVSNNSGSVTFVLSDPDYTTASRVASAINNALGADLALARDASGIEIRIPEGRRARLTKVIVDRGCSIPDGMVVGEDAELRSRRA